MAILGNFEVTVLSIHPSKQNQDGSLEFGWSQVQEHQPPGSESRESSSHSCRRYIGVPAAQTLSLGDRLSTEFAIDYKVRCGFTFADQQEMGAEYIVFRTYLDGERIGSASVKRERWERSGTYRIRKQGKRYRLENEHRWIRQRWVLDPGLHGTIKVEVWRESAKIDIWGCVDFTPSVDPVVGYEDLTNTSYEMNAKRPRIKNLEKLDLFPIATFEFEYRSHDTLSLLGLADTEDQLPYSQVGTVQVVSAGDNTIRKTITNTGSSVGTADTTVDSFWNDSEQQIDDTNYSFGNRISMDALDPMMEPTDAIGRSLLTGATISSIRILPLPCRAGSHTKSPEGGEIDAPTLTDCVENTWWANSEAPVGKTELHKLERTDFVDLTMLD